MNRIVGFRALGEREFKNDDGKMQKYDNVEICLLTDVDPEVIGFTAITTKLKREVAVRAFGGDDFSKWVGCDVRLIYDMGITGKPVLRRVERVGDPAPILFDGMTTDVLLGGKK